MNNNSQSWTDPITGEIYPAGNPADKLSKSSVIRPSKIEAAGASTAYQPYQANNPPAAQEPRRPARVVGGDQKFCEHCGSLIAKAAVICPACGCQVGEFRQTVQAQPVINNYVNNGNNIAPMTYGFGKTKNKWVAFVLCFFFGALGAHRFYEEKFGTGLLYLFTGGLFGLGWIADIIRILCKPNPYYP